MTNEKYAEWFRQNERMHITFCNDEEQTVEANGFYIRPEQKIEERKSIARTIEVEVTEYVVYGVKHIPGTYWEPPEYDEVELTREKSFPEALMRVKLIELEDDISNGLQDFEMAEAEKEYLEEIANG